MKKTAVRSYTDDQLLNRIKTIEGFKGFPLGRFIIGVRSNEDLFDTYDDKFYEFENMAGEMHSENIKIKFIRVITGTTNSGGKQLKGGFKSFNKYGSAILKADQWYYNVWSFGMHRGRMPALRQVGSKVTVYRDGDLDNKAEEIGSPISGWYGINYHTNTYDFSKKSLAVVKWFIGNWSAGCQVINDRDEYMRQMDYYRMAKNEGWQKFVSYCLINEFEPDEN
jgi:hypothetical protein